MSQVPHTLKPNQTSDDRVSLPSEWKEALCEAWLRVSFDDPELGRAPANGGLAASVAWHRAREVWLEAMASRALLGALAVVLLASAKVENGKVCMAKACDAATRPRLHPTLGL